MAVKDLSVRPPIVAPGQGVTEALKAGMYVAKGPQIGVASTSPVELFNLPPNTFVHELILDVTTAFDGTGTPSITLGDSDDADGFMDNTLAAPATKGSKSSKVDTQPYSGGKNYSSGGQLQAAFSAGASSNGVADTYIIYSSYSDLL